MRSSRGYLPMSGLHLTNPPVFRAYHSLTSRSMNFLLPYPSSKIGQNRVKIVCRYLVGAELMRPCVWRRGAAQSGKALSQPMTGLTMFHQLRAMVHAVRLLVLVRIAAMSFGSAVASGSGENETVEFGQTEEVISHGVRFTLGTDAASRRRWST